MLAFRGASVALRSSSCAPPRRARPQAWLHTSASISPTRTSSPDLQTRRYARAADVSAAATRSFATSSLLGVGATPPRRPATSAAARDNEDAVLSLPPTYKLLPDEVHCFLGLNGSGKTQFLARLQKHVKQQKAQGELPASCHLASLSLDAHRDFLAKNRDRVVADVLGGIGSPKARDLIVRLGLFPVWEQHVRHLSTGEMRKLLLAVALLDTPRASVLIMDQPFDGLDVRARRQLRWMLGQLTRGFTRLLVESTSTTHEAFAYKTQVLLVANRLEQVFPELFSHTVLVGKQSSSRSEQEPAMEIVSWPENRDDDKRNEAMMQRLEQFYDAEHAKRVTMEQSELVSLVQRLFKCQDSDADDTDSGLGVQLRDVSISYDQKRVLLEDVDFSRQRHEHWALLGPNGSGKSSLMRVLMQTPGHGLTRGDVSVVGQQIYVDGSMAQVEDTPVSEAISTDQHIQMLQQSVQRERQASRSAGHQEPTAFELLAANAANEETAELAMQLLALPGAVKTRGLAQLSQGEQKLVLIARALAARPELLILDEITHGLDPFNRAHVLRVVDTIGRVAARKTHLVLITHHEEEITPCFSGVFEIQDKQLVERSRSQGAQEDTG